VCLSSTTSSIKHHHQHDLNQANPGRLPYVGNE
jgi:hypothetical protein